MATVPGGKWIDGVASNDKTSRVARKSLAARLAAVRRSLSRSARAALTGSEPVHQLRVAARRAVESLKLYADFVPPRRAAWITKQMQQLRKAAGPARDCDVLISRLQSHTSAECPAFLIEELQGERRAAERAVVAAYRRLRKDGRFGRRAQALVSRVRPRGQAVGDDASLRFLDWARNKLRRRLQRLFDAAPSGTSDVESLHRFRIRAKKLRYTMELLAPAFPPTFRDEIYPVVETLQDKLGEINDCRTACEFLNERLQRGRETEQAQGLRGLAAAWETRLERSRAEFFDWWTTQRADDLGTAFEEMLADREETAEHFDYTERANDGIPNA